MSLQKSSAEPQHVCFGDIALALAEVDYACERVPHFREAAARMRLHRTQDPIASLLQAPRTAKPDYRKGFPRAVIAEGHSIDHPFVTRSQSSGTSGERLVSVVHAFTLAERMATCVNVNAGLRFLIDEPKIRTCRYAAPNCSDVECSSPHVTMEQRILADGTLVLPVYHDLLTTPLEMLRTAFEELHSYRPNLWYMDPMHLAHLIKCADAQGWKFQLEVPAAVLLSYSITTQVLRREVARLCGGRMPVAAVVAMSEFGFIGTECDRGRLHLNDQDYFLEFFEFGTDVLGNTVWELVITSIRDQLCPHIRYTTNDLYRLLPQCECGSALPTASFAGRRKDVARLDDGRLVTPLALDLIVGNPRWIDMYQLTLHGSGPAEFRYRGDAALCDTAAVRKLQSCLGQVLQAQPHLEPVEYFPFERGGKFQMIRGGNMAG